MTHRLLPLRENLHGAFGRDLMDFGERLDDAMYAALDGLKTYLRITPIMNETKGVHALLPAAAIAELGFTSPHPT